MYFIVIEMYTINTTLKRETCKSQLHFLIHGSKTPLCFFLCASSHLCSSLVGA